MLSKIARENAEIKDERDFFFQLALLKWSIGNILQILARKIYF
jgi:hypothetical protein